ncbi:DoxX family protein [Qipengyuania psychrotolerans]|uniref:DoxX family protein n=1 Tax=Qipengyuania psychrotolerans TaxID=2867238 RepID=A0ABX8ZEC3_9SPHN|nr:DoxX family protein [Qipengyuania psychrotolerans]QZD87362.1 DoxX family protein [Qipengyuania psychrotolerans]
MIRGILRWALAIFYAAAGYAHIANPEPFLSIMPGAIPAAEAIVFLTGVAEILGAIALVQPWSDNMRKAGGIGLALYAVCVFPANINHFVMDMAREDAGLGLSYHLPRMVAQPVIIWLALWVGGVTDWPRRRRSSD